MAIDISSNDIYSENIYAFHANTFEPRPYIKAIWDCFDEYMYKAFVCCVTQDDSASVQIERNSPLWDEIESQVLNQRGWD